MGENRHVYTVLVGKCKGKEPLTKPKGRWKYNTKLVTKETGSQDADWIHPAGCCGYDIESSNACYSVHNLQTCFCAKDRFLNPLGTNHKFPFVVRTA
jgi:hypothetical protein